MNRYFFILKRLLLTVPLLLGVVLLVFLMLKVTPGDPARQIVGLRATEQQLQDVREQLGLNDPVHVQYFRYVSDAVQGDLGYSFKSGQEVTGLITERLPVTAWLLVAGLLLSLVIAVPLAVYTALRRDRAADHVVRGAGLLGLAMPSYWVGTILILTIALPTGWFPVGGFGETTPERLRAIALPAFTLALAAAPILIRSLRASTLSILDSESVTTARSLGVRGPRLITRFVLRNAAPPVISVLALEAGFFLFGAVVIETTFALPGVGQGLVLAARQRDLPSIQGYTLLFALLVIAVYLIADIVTAVADPRLEIES